MGKIKYTFLLLLFMLVSGLSIFYASTTPSNTLNWEDELQLLVAPTVDGDIISFVNLRNSTYDENGRVALQYFNQSYNASDIIGLWMFVQPFGAWDKVAHTMISFEFSNGTFLQLSIEVRKEIGEEYDALVGIFNQFETIYLWGDEHDFITRRMEWLGDPIRMYEVEASEEFMKGFFYSLVEDTQSLQTQPAFYNTWTSSCTSAFVSHIRKVDPKLLDWWEHEFHFPGVVDRLFLQKGFIGDGESYEELKDIYTLYPADVNMSYSDFSLNLRK